MQMVIISGVLACDCPYSCHYSATLRVLHNPTHTHTGASILFAMPGVVLEKDPYS